MEWVLWTLQRVVWVQPLGLLCTYFHIICTMPFYSCDCLRSGDSLCGQWLFLCQSHYSCAWRTHLISVFSHFFNSKLCSVYSLSSKHKAVVMPCPFNGPKYGVTRSKQFVNDGWAEMCPWGLAGRACPSLGQGQRSWWAPGTTPPPGIGHLLWDRDRPSQARGWPTGTLSLAVPVARLGMAVWSWRPAAGTASPGRLGWVRGHGQGGEAPGGWAGTGRPLGATSLDNHQQINLYILI